MKYSLRSLMIVVALGPPLFWGMFVLFRSDHAEDYLMAWYFITLVLIAATGYALSIRRHA